MKHIKSYRKLFESSNDPKDELRDIGSDISDDGFDVKISTKSWEYSPGKGPVQKEISVFISKDRESRTIALKEFYISDISQCIQQMVNYMKAEGYLPEMYTMIGDRRSYLAWNDVVIPLDRNCLGGKQIQYVDITFKK